MGSQPVPLQQNFAFSTLFMHIDDVKIAFFLSIHFKWWLAEYRVVENFLCLLEVLISIKFRG